MRRLLLTIAALVLSVSAVGQDSLMDPMNRFAVAYNAFAAGMGNGIFDQRQAKRLSKLWRDVERSGEWPEAGK